MLGVCNNASALSVVPPAPLSVLRKVTPALLGVANPSHRRVPTHWALCKRSQSSESLALGFSGYECSLQQCCAASARDANRQLVATLRRPSSGQVQHGLRVVGDGDPMGHVCQTLSGVMEASPRARGETPPLCCLRLCVEPSGGCQALTPLHPWPCVRPCELVPGSVAPLHSCACGAGTCRATHVV